MSYVIKEWDDFYTLYRNSNPLRWPDINVVRLVKKVRLPKDSKVLDIGCGEGRHVRFFTEEGYSVFCVDASEAALNVCRVLYGIDREHLININIESGLKIFDEGSFDLILCWGVLHYIRNPERIIKDIYNMLKNGAFAILSFTSLRDERSSAAHICNKYEYDEVIDLVKNIGFKLLNIGLTENSFFTDNKIESYYWVLVEK